MSCSQGSEASSFSNQMASTIHPHSVSGPSPPSKLASLQEFIQHNSDASEMGCSRCARPHMALLPAQRKLDHCLDIVILVRCSDQPLPDKENEAWSLQTVCILSEERSSPFSSLGRISKAHKQYLLLRFAVKDVHRIGILDLRLFNTDRHAGNMLVREVPTAKKTSANTWLDSQLELIPIDHGFCLPEALEPPYLEWLHWPQVHNTCGSVLSISGWTPGAMQYDALPVSVLHQVCCCQYAQCGSGLQYCPTEDDDDDDDDDVTLFV